MTVVQRRLPLNADLNFKPLRSRLTSDIGLASGYADVVPQGESGEICFLSKMFLLTIKFLLTINAFTSVYRFYWAVPYQPFLANHALANDRTGKR